jgi:hypothetical protein
MPEGIICSAHVTPPLPITNISVPATAPSRHSSRDGAFAPRAREALPLLSTALAPLHSAPPP